MHNPTGLMPFRLTDYRHTCFDSFMFLFSLRTDHQIWILLRGLFHAVSCVNHTYRHRCPPTMNHAAWHQLSVVSRGKQSWERQRFVSAGHNRVSWRDRFSLETEPFNEGVSDKLVWNNRSCKLSMLLGIGPKKIVRKFVEYFFGRKRFLC